MSDSIYAFVVRRDDVGREDPVLVQHVVRRRCSRCHA